MLVGIPKLAVRIKTTLPAPAAAAARCPCCPFASSEAGVEAVVRLVHAHVAMKAVRVTMRPLVGVLDALVQPVVLDVVW